MTLGRCPLSIFCSHGTPPRQPTLILSRAELDTGDLSRRSPPNPPLKLNPNSWSSAELVGDRYDEFRGASAKFARAELDSGDYYGEFSREFSKYPLPPTS